MKCIPRYTVSYRGRWHNAGRAFDIDPADAEEMKKHGEVVDEPVQETAQEPKNGGSPQEKSQTVKEMSGDERA